MSNTDKWSLGDWLLEAGWRQGTLFSNPFICDQALFDAALWYTTTKKV